MDLIADLGNTRSHLALFEGERIVAQTSAMAVCGPEETRARWNAFADEALGAGRRPLRAAMAEVNPRTAELFSDWVRERFDVAAPRLGHDLPCPIPLEVEAPERVGPDRLANAVWAVTNYPGRSVIVVDLGTAVTFDVVSARGTFLGGVIAAGVDAEARALAERTARLPRVSLAEDSARPTALGKSTEQALRAGLFWGAVGLVNSVCAQIAIELEEDPLVVATGGDAARIAPACPCIARVAPELTLSGVRLALLRRAGSGRLDAPAAEAEV